MASTPLALSILRGLPDGPTDFTDDESLGVWAKALTLPKHSLLTACESSLNVVSCLYGPGYDSPEKTHAFLSDVLYFAYNAHKGQFRKDDKTEYIYHIVRLVYLFRLFLPDYAGDWAKKELVDALAALMLHDVVEDCDVTYSEISKRFGLDVAENVFWLTEDTKPRAGNRKTRKALAARKIAKAPLLVQMLKLLDVFDNMYCCKDYFTPKFYKLFHEEKLVMVSGILDSFESDTYVELTKHIKAVIETRLKGI